MAINNQSTLADNAIVCAITIPANNSAATLLSLMSSVSSLLSGKTILEVKIEQHATDFNWGHSAAACLALGAVDIAVSIPCLWALDHYVESTTAGTVAAVAIIYVKGA